ncbi:MAG: DNA polymerase IV [Bacillota bacterium]
MKKYRILFHVDLNAFFASCEMAENKNLKNIPLGIGPQSDRGILTTANYEARKYGVTSAMPLQEARRLCPKLKVLPTNFELYKKYSGYFFDYLRSYTDKLEPASIDEGYLDMTEVVRDKHPVEVAQKIQDDLLERYDLPVSIGIAPNMFLAKMASDMKKPKGITVLRKRDVKKKLWPLPIEALHGIGRKTVPNLKLLGIETIGDLATFKDKKKLHAFLGNSTDSFIKKVHGEDERVLDPTRQEKHQSIGNSKTFDGYLHEYQEMIEALEQLAKRVSERLKEKDLACKTITVQMRTASFENHSKAFTMEYHTNNVYELMGEVEHLFDSLYKTDEPVHLLGVSASSLQKTEQLFKQLTIYEVDQSKDRNQEISHLLKTINSQYGKKLLKKGIDKDTER